MSSNHYRPAEPHMELPSEQLRWRCETSRLPFETPAQAERREGFIGQERALRALKMGAELSAPGYNVFVCGLAGTSRGGTIARMIEELHPPTKESLDRCYVNNFKLTDRPRLLAVPRGQANALKKDVQAGIGFLRRRIPQVFEGEPFQRQKGRIVDRFTVREKELMDDFTRRIAREQFALGHMQVGGVALPEIFPVLEGQMVPIEDVSKMVHEGKLEAPVAEEIERKYEQFRQEFTVVYRKTLTLSRELASELSYLEQEAASVLVDGVIEELKEKYPGANANVAEYLEEVRHHVLDNLEPFKEHEGEREEGEESGESGMKTPGPDRDPFRVYGVNVILAHDDENASPVIFETTPTYANLFGTIQRAYDARGGGWSSDFMDLRGGSLLRADGGFLIMYAVEALSETGVWRALKRTLNHNRLEIQPLEMFFPLGASPGRIARPRRPRARRDCRQGRAPQPDRNAHPRNDRRRNAAHRRRRRARRTGERPQRTRDRRLFLRQAGAHHGDGGDRQIRADQHRARSELERPLPRQGHADHRRLSAQPLRAGQAAIARRKNLPPAIVFRCGRRQREHHGSVRAALRALRTALAAGPRGHGFRQSTRRHPGDRRSERKDRRLLRCLPREGARGHAGGDDSRRKHGRPHAAR